MILTFTEAGKFTNPAGTPAVQPGATSWPKGKPFTIRGYIQYYNEGTDSWMTIDSAMDVVVQLNQSSASYKLWQGKAGTTGDGSFVASCLIPGDAAGGVGQIAIHVLGNTFWAESWLVEDL
ncbi:MAG: hypothetical protein QW379_00945 [Thermoplasmata archaeon]